MVLGSLLVIVVLTIPARGKRLSDKPSVGKPAARHQAIPACGGISSLQLYSSC